LCISGNSYVTSNMYMLEVVGIWNGINYLFKSNSTSSATYKMAEKMKKKMANIGVNLTNSICC